MGAAGKKAEIVTFKVDGALREAMRHIGNRSEFIRCAVLAALGNVCPLCNGRGVLMASQARHFQQFMRAHRVEDCPECDGPHIVCGKKSEIRISKSEIDQKSRPRTSKAKH